VIAREPEPEQLDEPDWARLLDELNAAEAAEDEPDLNDCLDWEFEP
jgi:hypothetical protein